MKQEPIRIAKIMGKWVGGRVESVVPTTYADTSALEEDYGFKPSTSLRDGLKKFAEWYKKYYK